MIRQLLALFRRPKPQLPKLLAEITCKRCGKTLTLDISELIGFTPDELRRELPSIEEEALYLHGETCTAQKGGKQK